MNNSTYDYPANDTCASISVGIGSTWSDFFACYVYFLPQQLPISLISYVIILGSIVFNVAVIILLACKGKYKTVFDEILISHGVINLLTGGVDLQFYVIGWLFNYWTFEEYTCIAWLTFDNMLATSEILHVLYLGWVRVRCVLKPKSYTREVYVKYSTVILVLTWVIPAAVWLALALQQNLATGFQQFACQIQFDPPALAAFIIFVTLILPLLLIIASTVFMVITLNSNRNKITGNATQMASQAATMRRTSTVKSKPRGNKNTQKKLSIIISVFLIQYSPYSFMWFVDTLCNNCVPGIIYTVLVILTFLPSLSNPLLIIVLNVKQVCLKKFKDIN